MTDLTALKYTDEHEWVALAGAVATVGITDYAAGKLGDVKQHWPSLADAVGTLRAAGAWISLAHPYQYDFTRTKRRKLVADFIAGMTDRYAASEHARITGQQLLM